MKRPPVYALAAIVAVWLGLLLALQLERPRRGAVSPVTVEVLHGDGSSEYRTFDGRPGLVQPTINGQPTLLMVGKDAIGGQMEALVVVRILLWDPDGGSVEVRP